METIVRTSVIETNDDELTTPRAREDSLGWPLTSHI